MEIFMARFCETVTPLMSLNVRRQRDAVSSPA